MWPIPIESTQTASEEYSQKFIPSLDRFVISAEEPRRGLVSLASMGYFVPISNGGSIIISGAKIIPGLEERPNLATQTILRQAEVNYEQGNSSPTFRTGEEAIAWLEEQGI